MKIFFVSALFIALSTASTFPESYSCPLCKDFLRERFVEGKSAESVCTRLQACDYLMPKLGDVIIATPTMESIDYTCRSLAMCVQGEEEYKAYARKAQATASPINLRVARGYGPRGYNTLRISVIDNTSTAAMRDPEFRKFFDYSEAFRYRWTNKHLHTSVVEVTPGVVNTVVIGDYNVSVRIPKEGAPSRGIFMADPCFSSEWIICPYGGTLQIFSRLTSMLNAVASKGDLDYWMILGDMFYDRDGSLSDQFFNTLNLAVLQMPLTTTAGNHDYWVYGSPWLASSPDQFGNGFLQYYPMDTAAANSTTPFDFTNDPDHPSSIFNDRSRIPTPQNYFFTNKIGNVAFMGYSGAYTYDSMLSYFQQGCLWMKEQNPDVAFLIGHWNIDGQGCDSDMTVPSVYASLRSVPGCSDLGDKFKYIMGHTHCNQVVETDHGFMVAGFGMIPGCGNFGLPYVDTNNGRLEILYFPIADLSGTNNYDALLSCVNSNGLSNCKQHATVWFNASLSSL